MEFEVLTSTDASKAIRGTSRLGYMETTLQKLVATFGQPEIYENYELAGACDWTIRFADGSVARIYPPRTEPKIPTKRYLWHVGGNRLVSLAYLSHILKLPCLFVVDEDPEMGAEKIPF